MEIKESGRLETDGGAKNTCSPHEKNAQTGDHTIPGVEVECALAARIQDQQVMSRQYGFGHD